MNAFEFIQIDHYNRVVNSAKDCIKQHGKLRWCNSKICACMGCANRFMSEVDYHEAISIPEIQAITPFPFPIEVSISNILKELDK